MRRCRWCPGRPGRCDRDRLDVAEVVVDAGLARGQRDGADLGRGGHRAVGRAVDRADRGGAEQVAAGLRLGDLVSAGPQRIAAAVGPEAVGAVGGGGGRGGDRLAEVVGAGQGQRDAGDARLARIQDAVAVGVLVDGAADGDRLDVAEVVVDAATGPRSARSSRSWSRKLAVPSAVPLTVPTAVAPRSSRSGALGDLVGAGQQRIAAAVGAEAVGAVGGRGGRGTASTGWKLLR